jgi:hypothetical protein
MSTSKDIHSELTDDIEATEEEAESVKGGVSMQKLGSKKLGSKKLGSKKLSGKL